MSPSELPEALFAFPGPLRDRLVGAILDGSKTTTTGLLVECQRDGEPVPQVGSRQVVLDSDGCAVAVIEIVAAPVARLAEVGLAHAVAEGEGYRSVAAWRAAQEEFWNGPEVRAELDESFLLDDDTLVVLETFRVVDRRA